MFILRGPNSVGKKGNKNYLTCSKYIKKTMSFDEEAFSHKACLKELDF